jgi:hypothetical protein
MTFEDVMRVLRCVIDEAREKYEFVPFDEVAECVKLDYGISDRGYVEEVLRTLAREDKVHKVGLKYFPTIYGIIEEKLYDVHRGLKMSFPEFKEAVAEVAVAMTEEAIRMLKKSRDPESDAMLGLLFTLIKSGLEGRKAKPEVELEVLRSPTGFTLKELAEIKPEMTGLEAIRYLATFLGCATRFFLENMKLLEKKNVTPQMIKYEEEYLNKCIIEHMD